MSIVTETRIEADPTVPVIHITRDFAGTPEQLLRAHTDPELFVRWVGPDGLRSRIDHWDARTGGSWRYVATRGDDEHAFRGCFHECGRTASCRRSPGRDAGLGGARDPPLRGLGRGRTRCTPPRSATASPLGTAGCRAAWSRDQRGLRQLDGLLRDGAA